MSGHAHGLGTRGRGRGERLLELVEVTRLELDQLKSLLGRWRLRDAHRHLRLLGRRSLLSVTVTLRLGCGGIVGVAWGSAFRTGVLATTTTTSSPSSTSSFATSPG